MTTQESSPVSDLHNTPLVLMLDDASATLEQVGGKGASLARMAASGLPVPPGFFVTTAAYRRFVVENGLQKQILEIAASAIADQPATLDEASRRIGQLFTAAVMPDEIAAAIRQQYAKLGDQAVAVRSSATAEDLPEMSFAGQQETYLNMRGATMVLDAVKYCWASLWTARAIGYRARHNIAPQDVSLAVVVQELVSADAAGILFTANPLTGEREQIVINAAWGLGEAIVGGQVTPDTIIFDKASSSVIKQEIAEKSVMTVCTPDGTHEEPVPVDKRKEAAITTPQAGELARIASQIEQIYGQPMDVEWVIKDGRISIVQARPITTLRSPDATIEAAKDVWNDSLIGNYLWTNANLGEAVPDVMTPATWSIIQMLVFETVPLPSLDNYRIMGNIAGRFYINLSLLLSLATVFGIKRQIALERNENFFGRVPDDVEIPLIPLSRWRVISRLIPEVAGLLLTIRRYQRGFPTFLAESPARCDRLRAQIKATSNAQDLIRIWQAEIEPFFREALRTLRSVAQGLDRMLRADLRKLVGEADANALIGGLSSGANQLASLELLLGLEQLARGEIDRETFARRYGHRGAHEMELSIARPAEDPDWIERQLASTREAGVDVRALLSRQNAAHAAAWERFRQRYPRQAGKMRRRIDQSANAARKREAARSEGVRVFWVVRAFVQRAGELTGQGDELFFLSIAEILTVLGGDETPLARIEARHALYNRYCALPPYPGLIRGHFDPFHWAADPHRRSDLFDEGRDHIINDKDAITGFPGSEGIVEGRARVVATVEEGDQLQAGEILVTTTTNVGWTPLFPRAAAIVTDVGAPLSHASIIARELGIPAVVGCGNATMRLHTGDLIRVNGEQGTVEVLQAVGTA
ncbi:MAG TPA: PEP/pyruvate-binding domain-containing protein [Ktedonobacteraceae bacterium]|nr:PEP/pyruvate-binding domain-containing protein [Ktedonobacteraceae bacterium]